MKITMSIFQKTSSIKEWLFSLLLCILFSSCASIQAYERIYVNDPEMQMSTDQGQQFIKYVHSIREGATPSGASKASGGCGCN